MNSCPSGENATQLSEPGSSAGIESADSGETLIGTALAGTGQAETILLVEDEAFLRRATAEVLASAGYKLIVAGSATEAFEAYRCSGPVDLLLADIVMPGMSGCELAAKFSNLCPLTRILLMSGYPEPIASSAGAFFPKTYLPKPFSSRTLLSKVRAVLDATLPHSKASA